MKPASLSALALHRLDVLFRRIGQTVSWDTLSTGDRVNIYVLEDQDLLQLTNYGGHKLRRLHKRSVHPFAHSTDGQNPLRRDRNQDRLQPLTACNLSSKRVAP
jgi:hypothetical protein